MSRTPRPDDGSAQVLRDAVDGARRAGHGWDAIGEMLGISPQAARQRFGSGPAEPTDPPDRKVASGVNALNELSVMEEHGEQGYHLVEIGVRSLLFERSDRRWQHVRLTASRRATRRRLEAEGWEVIARSFPFTYLKRPVDP